MTELATLDAYGVLIEPATLKIQRLLPGPIERVWAYLTESELRRQWLAAGEMEMKVGAPFELVWRNDELTDPPGERPAGFARGAPDAEPDHRARSAPQARHHLGQAAATSPSSWSRGATRCCSPLIHRRLPDRATLLKVGPGWHMHLDILVARVTGKEPEPFWDGWSRLQKDYEQRWPE